MPHASPAAGHNVGGNLYPKYTTRNPAARWLVAGFLDALDGLVRRTGAREIHEVARTLDGCLFNSRSAESK